MQALYRKPLCGAAGFSAVPRRRHAVVVGGSLAGMLAARVLAGAWIASHAAADDNEITCRSCNPLGSKKSTRTRLDH